MPTVRLALLVALALLVGGPQAAQAKTPGVRSCKPVETAGVKYTGVQTNIFTCRAARSVLAAYARKPPKVGEGTVSIGRQRYVCWVYRNVEPDGGGCGAKKRRGAISFRIVKWAPPSYAKGCGETATVEGTDEGIYRIRTVGLDCENVRTILGEWAASGYPGDGPAGWSQCRSLPLLAGVQVAWKDPRVWFDLG